MFRFLLLLGLSATTALAQGPPTAVHAIRAQLRETVQRESVTGSLRAASEAVLAAREEGPVDAVPVREGMFVRQGEILVELDASRLRVQLAEAKAASAEAAATRVRRAAELDDANQDLAAYEAASGGDAVSERELRVARTRVAAAKADADAAEQRELALIAQEELLGIRIGDMTVRAPFDGTVVARHIEVGEWVMPGAPLVELVSTSKLEVWLDVPERLLATVRSAGTELQIQTAGTGAGASNGAEPRAPLVATGMRVVPRVDQRSRNFPVVLTIDAETAGALSPGMSASAWLPIGDRRPTLMVPKDALVYRPGGVSVMVVQGKDEGGASLSGVAGQVPVSILFETKREVALSADSLAPGTVVIVEGNERLMSGTPVAATISSKNPGDARRGDGPR